MRGLRPCSNTWHNTQPTRHFASQAIMITMALVKLCTRWLSCHYTVLGVVRLCDGRWWGCVGCGWTVVTVCCVVLCCIVLYGNTCHKALQGSLHPLPPSFLAANVSVAAPHPRHLRRAQPSRAAGHPGRHHWCHRCWSRLWGFLRTKVNSRLRSYYIESCLKIWLFTLINSTFLPSWLTYLCTPSVTLLLFLRLPCPHNTSFAPTLTTYSLLVPSACTRSSQPVLPSRTPWSCRNFRKCCRVWRAVQASQGPARHSTSCWHSSSHSS